MKKVAIRLISLYEILSENRYKMCMKVRWEWDWDIDKEGGEKLEG